MAFERVGDVNLFYELIDCSEPWGQGRSPVLFLHGLGGTHHLFSYQVPAFCGRFPTLSLDLRNHGASSAIDAEFGTAEMARDVARLLRRMGVEHAHVAGVSLGGMVALQLAIDFPMSVASLTLVDTMAGIPDEARPVARESLKFIDENPMAKVAEARITNAFSPKVDPIMRDYVIDQVAKNDKKAYVRAAHAAFAFDVRDRLAEIKKPTLVVVGDADAVTPPLLSEELVAGIPGARLVTIPNCGHISNMEQPQEFNRVVLDFLSSAPR